MLTQRTVYQEHVIHGRSCFRNRRCIYGSLLCLTFHPALFTQFLLHSGEQNENTTRIQRGEILTTR